LKSKQPNEVLLVIKRLVHNSPVCILSLVHKFLMWKKPEAHHQLSIT